MGMSLMHLQLARSPNDRKGSFMKNCLSGILIFSAFSVSAFAGVSIGSPSNGDHVSSPFNLSATATSCSSQSVQSMGYSIDYGDTTVLHGQMSIDSKVSASIGTHVVHVKAWGNNGAVCVSDVAITVANQSDDAAADDSNVPADAVSVSSLEALRGWSATRDRNTYGSATGKTDLVGTPSHGGVARKFEMTYNDRGAERYSISFGDNTTSKNFFYDAWIYVTDTSSHIANLEIDVNQTMPNGQTVIFGIQCDGYSSTWDYTENLGSASNPKGYWAHTSAYCNPRDWSRYKWHHIQMEYSRTSGGHITYKYVWFDGKRSTIDKYVYGARALGWGNTLSVNFQVDGRGTSGSSTVYLDDLTIYRW